MLDVFFDQYLNRVIVIVSLAVTILYVISMIGLGIVDTGVIVPKAVTFVSSSGAFVTCVAGMVMMAFKDDKWLGNVQKFRLHLALGCLAGGATTGILLCTELVPVVRKFLAIFV